MKEHGLKEDNIHFSERALRDLINYYTRESGVRNLEREIANICRKVARNMVSGKKTQFRITEKNLENYLGKKRFRYDIITGEAEVGVTTGLAWTIVGGDTLFIETTVVPEAENWFLPGSWAKLCRKAPKPESVISVPSRISLESIRISTKKRICIFIFRRERFPKDGPSAGVTMCTAIISTLTGYAGTKGHRHDRRNYPERQGPSGRRNP